METGLIKFPGRSLARERKKIHESSEHIYPTYETNDALNIARQQNISSFATTSYSIDFARKEGKPALPRPCSVTRRNRPHPSEKFLIWRIASKPVYDQKSNDAIGEFWNLSNLATRQRFYDDYVGRPYADKCKLCLHTSSLTSRYPARPTVIQRAVFEEKFKKEEEPSTNSRCTMPPLCISKDAGQKYAALLQKRPSNEKILLDSCFEAGDRGYLEESWVNVVHPEAIPGIQNWLTNKDETDCKVVMKFLTSLSKGTNRKNDKELERKSGCTQLPCLDTNNSAAVSKAGRDAILKQVQQIRPKEAPRTKEPNVTRSEPLKKGKKSSRLRQRALVHNNADSLFMQPRRCQPRHFEIHPEFRGILTQ
ncbi:uncharacterized protein [Montipora foliosa]|uniref:uncharacterized protein n=1 Tax=Montipora foliosa TaxID=591990 RepID=UPI0035F185E8